METRPVSFPVDFVGSKPQQQRRPRKALLILGVVMSVISPIVTAIFLVLGAFTINPCGAFADGCDDYGKATTLGTTMFLLAGVAALGFVVGIAVVIVDIVIRYQSRESRSAV
jgi:ABC-type Fe3+ transport system permease subunit